MRTYYIFKINPLFNTINRKNSTSIYKLLKKIKIMNKRDINVGKNIYKRLVIPLNKELLNNYILSNHINDVYYIKNNRNHYLESIYEISKLSIYNSYLKIETNINISTFFKDIYPISDNMICIDFDNIDYFFLDDLKEKLLV